MALSLSVTSALNLTLEGSTGSFSVGRETASQQTVEVKYFLTHVGLNLLSGANEELLRHLAPVREVFPPRDLGFDEIMQRDIDDARVSSELVPYLLDRKSRDLVKLFPPIVVVVMPVETDANRPANHYPAVTSEDGTENGHPCKIVRSGEKGQEVFEFVQPFEGGKLYQHDLVRLKLNTNRCRLVIVDGQHRAMALLALYRNLKQDWEDKNKAPYKDYYEEWTPNYIKSFELANISLPIMFCTFPALDENFSGEYNVKMAARSIFLTLNKTARQVSASRNRLLDDNDIVALLLRDTLSSIKAFDDIHAPSSLRIHNIELDQAHDRVKIESPIAISGVNHFYYMIEHILLNRLEDVSGAKPRAGNYYLRSDLTNFGAMRRLNGWNLLGEDLANATNRFFYTTGAGETLGKEFRDRFGKFIVATFERFVPYEAHTSAVLWLDEQLRLQANTKIRPILFEGQGIGRTFENHRKHLDEKIREKEFGAEAPKLQEILGRLDATRKMVADYEVKLKAERANRFLAKADKKGLRGDDGQLYPKVVEFITWLYDNVLTTVAFQTAIIGGFFGELERANIAREKLGQEPLETQASFDKFIDDLNEFFEVVRPNDFRRLVEVFQGTLGDEIGEWKITPSASTFKRVVYRGEMQPAQWPKYKYLLLELWRATGTDLEASIAGERDVARFQIFNSLEKEYQKDFLERNLRREESLTTAERNAIRTEAYDAFCKFLRNLGWKASDVPTKKSLVEAPQTEDANAAPEVATDDWDDGDASSVVEEGEA
ncbi:DNA sulfur modification protein DndB [Sphingomonas oryzagri]|uniref:DNA sulfur modification protein DndB n=1 Tax=Sphingomonas oryzagri TaxID=3042314 RepID=A0ABT6N565_9SPHN|nr:DNA sulfur modification protein DndB [Sphingomonas oryzagri]MDH7640249.1 DNA sulfur modification protein DndB [Sphingomonas oryzagri]